MRYKRSLLILAALSLGLIASQAHASPNLEGYPVYSKPAAAQTPKKTLEEQLTFQMILGNISLSEVDRAFCDGKVGAENEKNKTEYRSCHVTRNFLGYAQQFPKDVEGYFPPMAELKYCRTKAERAELIARLKAA